MAPWYLERVGLPRAWAQVDPAVEPIKIGLLDSGLDLAHPRLQPQIGPSLNLLEPGAPPWDAAGHGTAVAGLLLRALGPVQPQLLPVKLLDERSLGAVGDLIRGLYWCAEQGCELINLSAVAGARSLPALSRAVEALERAGVLLIAAAGNGGRAEQPGALATVVAVGSTDRCDRPVAGPTGGEGPSLLAPGVGITIDRPGGGQRRSSGSSLAAPLVTAAAALLLTRARALGPEAVRSRLLETAEALPGDAGPVLLRADYLLGADSSSGRSPCAGESLWRAPSSRRSATLTEGPPRL